MFKILENSKNWSFTYGTHLAPRWHRKPWQIILSRFHRPSCLIDHLIHFDMCCTVERRLGLNDVDVMDPHHACCVYPNWDSAAFPAP